jgi:DNA-binding response OmpR family regulator
MDQPTDLKVSRKILIVDDDPAVHKLITKRLESGPYQIQSVFDAPTAITEIRKFRPDLVILDLMMPRISGIEVCRDVKSHEETKDILVLILSAKESQDDRIKGLEFGADDYISKPFHLASLVRKIEYMLSKKT